MTATYASVLALSAFLVFWIQPLVARMLLPVLGGTPAVWNTCVLFFQGMLLVGYLYSHGLTRLTLGRQALVHAVFFSIVLIALPDSPGSWIAPVDGSNSLWLLGELLIYVGLPFVFLSSSAPLLQHWFGLSNRRSASDPYFLYAASNVGSFLALLLFPTMLERFLPMSEQISIWHNAFLALALGLLSCLAFIWRRATSTKVLVAPASADPPTPRHIARWLVFAFVPSSLMLGITTHITTDIASVSFLWVLPLGLYLATFIVAFSRYGESLARTARNVLPLFIAGALLLIVDRGSNSLLLIPVELAIVTCVSLILHSRLYLSRPALSLLTFFYLWVAFGGFLGGLLNGLLAPMIFPGIIEYPLVLSMGILIVEWPLVSEIGRIIDTKKWNGLGWVNTAIITAIASLISWMIVGTEDMATTSLIAGTLVVSFLATAYAIGTTRVARIYVSSCFLIYFAASIVFEFRGAIHSGRTFFGAFRIDDAVESGVEYRRFRHGTTLHGLQAKDPRFALTVQSYYRPLVEIVWPYFANNGPTSIGVTGLGTGTLACLGRAEDSVTFFEIDPVVEQVAREYFSYLNQCAPTVNVILGDARLSLTRIRDEAFDLLILDAFSSDSVPIHLITSEAAELYDRVLKDDGLLVFHISNRYIDLGPVLARLADDQEWSAWEISFDQRPGKPLELSSRFILISKGDQVDKLLVNIDGAKRLSARPGFRLWTDDYSNLLAILRFKSDD